MDITPDLADRLYTILVQTIGAPDDYRRWSFIYATTEGHVASYLIDSYLGFGARFQNKPTPIVSCAPDEENAKRKRMVRRVNALIAEIVEVKPATIVRPIAIRETRAQVAVPVIQVPTVATVQQLCG